MRSLPLWENADSDHTTWSETLQTLHVGQAVVLPTDTLYGIVASALLPSAVERLFTLRKRAPDKPLIILIGDESELERFSIFPDAPARTFLKRYWPGKISIIFPVLDTKWDYLHRGKQTLAFRVPADEALREFLIASGPLAAPSANIAGEPPATIIEEAQRSFGEHVALYIDGGKCESLPSTLVEWTPAGVKLLRPGAVTIDPTYLNSEK